MKLFQFLKDSNIFDILVFLEILYVPIMVLLYDR